mgnify:CR=1 FL=1
MAAMQHLSWVKVVLRDLLAILIGAAIVSQSVVTPGSPDEAIRAYTRMNEFDYVNWTLNALLVKGVQGALQAPRYMSAASQHELVYEYLDLLRQENAASASVDRIYANPDVKNPDQAAASANQALQAIEEREKSLKPLVESILQNQVSTTIAEMGLAVGGQPIPPVLYHSTSLPDALIISPRNVIREDHNISLNPGLSTAQINQLENNVENAQTNVSALVVPIGGVGIYPTMVMNTTDLEWLLETVAHEWTHNFLTLRPVGALYMSSAEMRTINETTANISGKEISRQVIIHYYPDLTPPPLPLETETPAQPAPTPIPEAPNTFNFNREMHNTRVQVDALLAEGKIKQAEDYMEAQRRVFWEHGYQIRKLNQAYFAFYGAYNDVPGGGAAGKDPVGPAVQALRQKSASLADFLNRIAWVTSFSQLQALANQP